MLRTLRGQGFIGVAGVGKQERSEVIGNLARRHSPVTGCPPSYLGGSQTRMAQSSPTEVTRTASGGSGTSAEGRMVRGVPQGLGEPPMAHTPSSLCLPTTRRKMEATSSPTGLVTLMV